MPSALSIIGAITLGVVGALGMYAWDRHPPLGLHAHVLFWRPGFDLPDSLATQRDKATTAMWTAVAATGQCQAAIKQQNLEVSRVADLGMAAIARASAALNASKSEVASLRRASASLKTYAPVGADACARWADADRVVKIMLEGR